jgi:16S rRNA processing protein RimM
VAWTGADGRDRTLEVAARRDAPPDVLLRFAGVDGREGAETLAGGLLRVPASRLPRDPDPDVVFVRDLVGCRVLMGDRDLGTVADVLARPANDVLEVARPGAPAVLVPFTRDAVVDLDVPGRRIVVRRDLLDPGAAGDDAPGPAGA